MSTELVLVAPVLLLLLLFVVYVGRLADTQLTVQHAAHQAARAATLARDPITAAVDANDVARASLESCTAVDVAVDTSDFRPGATVTVVVSCRMSNADLAGLGVPGGRSISATAASVLDTWRAVSPEQSR